MSSKVQFEQMYLRSALVELFSQPLRWTPPLRGSRESQADLVGSSHLLVMEPWFWRRGVTSSLGIWGWLKEMPSSAF